MYKMKNKMTDRWLAKLLCRTRFSVMFFITIPEVRREDCQSGHVHSWSTGCRIHDVCTTPHGISCVRSRIFWKQIWERTCSSRGIRLWKEYSRCRWIRAQSADVHHNSQCVPYQLTRPPDIVSLPAVHIYLLIFSTRPT